MKKRVDKLVGNLDFKKVRSLRTQGIDPLANSGDSSKEAPNPPLARGKVVSRLESPTLLAFLTGTRDEGSPLRKLRVVHQTGFSFKSLLANAIFLFLFPGPTRYFGDDF